MWISLLHWKLLSFVDDLKQICSSLGAHKNHWELLSTDALTLPPSLLKWLWSKFKVLLFALLQLTVNTDLKQKKWDWSECVRNRSGCFTWFCFVLFASFHFFSKWGFLHLIGLFSRPEQTCLKFQGHNRANLVPNVTLYTVLLAVTWYSLSIFEEKELLVPLCIKNLNFGDWRGSAAGRALSCHWWSQDKSLLPGS